MKRSSWILAGLAIIAVVASAWVALYPARRLPRDPLQSVPADAVGLARVRLDRWLASDAVRRALAERGHTRGIERIKQVCGFDPLAGLREVVLFARPVADGKRPKLAFSARGDIQHLRLMRCVAKLGRSDEELIHEELHGIRTVRSRNGAVRAAFVGAEGLVAGDADSVARAIAAIVGKAPSAKEDALLSRLYRELPADADLSVIARSAGSEAVVAQLLAALGLAERVQAADLSALSLSARLRDGNITARASVLTTRAELARRLVREGEALRSEVLAFPMIAITTFAKPLRELALSAEGERATLVGSVPVHTLAAAFDVVPALKTLQRSLQADPAPPADAAIAPAP